MKNSILAAVAFAVSIGANSAAADVFVMTLEAPLEGISDGLYQSVKITPLESFTAHDVNYIALDAPSEVYVETLFSVYGTWPMAMHAIDMDWESYSTLSAEMKLLNMEPIFCRFCLGE